MRHLRSRVRGQDRLGKRRKAFSVRRQLIPDRGQRRHQLLRGQWHADNARRRRQDLVPLAAKSLRRGLANLLRRRDPDLSRRAVRVARIHGQYAHQPAIAFQMPPPYRDRRSLYAIRREHRCRTRNRIRHRDRKVCLPTGLDARLHRRKSKPARQRLLRDHQLLRHRLNSPAP